MVAGNRASVNSQDSLWHIKDDQHQNGYVNGQARHDPGDYAHYPRPEEYLVTADDAGDGKLWQYTLGNGDQYAVPNKLKPQTSFDQHQLNSSAVPVPFSHQHPSMKFQMIGNGIISRGPEVQLGFEDGSDQFQDESHASTPRKVIREIIV